MTALAPPRVGKPVAAVWLPLLAAPIAMANNAPGLLFAQLATDLGTSVVSVAWVITAFGLGLAVGTPLAGHLIRGRGARAALVVSALFFLLGILLVLVAPTVQWLIAGRAIQGFGGSGLMVVAINAAGTVARAGLVTAGAGVGGALGPVVGLLVTSVSSWHLALAVGAVALIAVPFVAPQLPTAAPERVKFDTVGAALFLGLVLALVLSTRFSIAAVMVVVTLVPLVLWIRVRPEGFVPVALVRSKRYLMACALILVLSVGYFFLLYRVPAELRSAEWGAIDIGIAQLVVLLAGSALSMFLAANFERFGRARVLAAVLVLAVIAQVLGELVGLDPLLPLAGLGLAVLAMVSAQAGLMIIGTERLSQAHRPVAVGLYSLFFQLGGAFGPLFAALLY
ncbi:MFS transporter [Actinokineospora diospyrosa]|uniref:Major Facilitator Superfamily protein n=1 Tax=Actinokineospora diospyrosa TaxID=103728 RepID=A0ABT1ILJ4_9PSEU|nr:MFS transporter [Actinokineospora diospyrosa]MCP2273521.1 Major Facilitator Superfamily protein [Actinokineospora diospyrosa]